MRITIPLVVLVAVLAGPSAFAQSPSQDNAGQIPNNSGARSAWPTWEQIWSGP